MFYRLYVSPAGRVSRRFYWLFGVIPAALIGLLAAVIVISTHSLVAAWTVCLLAVWPVQAMQIKRCHDFSVSGWICLLSLIPYFGFLFHLAIGFLPGVSGANRFGSDPLILSVAAAPSNYLLERR